jgi:hypothetical protein
MSEGRAVIDTKKVLSTPQDKRCLKNPNNALPPTILISAWLKEPPWASTLTRNCFNLQQNPSTNKREIPLSLGAAVLKKSMY